MILYFNNYKLAIPFAYNYTQYTSTCITRTVCDFLHLQLYRGSTDMLIVTLVNYGLSNGGSKQHGFLLEILNKY